MTSIFLKEYEAKEKPKELDLKELERFLVSRKLENILDITPSYIKAKNYVGVIKYKNTQINILPKLSNKNDNQAILKNLFYMLSYTRALQIKQANSANLAKSNNPFLEILIGSFAQSLYENLLLYIPKRYIEQSENLNVLKGKINFTQNIKHNHSNQAKFFCNYDEFCEDNLLNRLFLYVSKNLLNVTENSDNKKILKQILFFLEDVSLVNISYSKAKTIVLSRHQINFKPALDIALLFLENSSVDMSSHSFKTISIIFNMNELFEKFVYMFIRRHQDKLGVKGVAAQKGKKLIESAVNLENTDKDDRKFKITRTDILITCDNTQTIIDTKYKKHDGSKGGFLTGDMYQMMAYKTLNPEAKVILLYPQDNEDFHWELTVANSEAKIYTASINLKVDNLKENKDELVKRIANILNKENSA